LDARSEHELITCYPEGRGPPPGSPRPSRGPGGRYGPPAPSDAERNVRSSSGTPWRGPPWRGA